MGHFLYLSILSNAPTIFFLIILEIYTTKMTQINSHSKVFPELDTTIFRGYFYIMAYVSGKQKRFRKK